MGCSEDIERLTRRILDGIVHRLAANDAHAGSWDEICGRAPKPRKSRAKQAEGTET